MSIVHTYPDSGLCAACYGLKGEMKESYRESDSKYKMKFCSMECLNWEKEFDAAVKAYHDGNPNWLQQHSDAINRAFEKKG